jgi:hypothetical protein
MASLVSSETLKAFLDTFNRHDLDVLCQALHTPGVRCKYTGQDGE